MARLDFELAERELLDDLLSREPEDWDQVSKRSVGSFFKGLFGFGKKK